MDDTVNNVGRYASSGHSTGDAVSCFRCGGKYSPSGCWARSVQCYKFHNKGDLAKMCDKKGKIQPTRYLEVDSPRSTTKEQSGLGLYTLKSKGQGGSGFQVQLLLEGKPVSMEVDTGSAVSIVSKVEYKKWFKHLKLQPTQFHLKTYSGESLSLLGEIRVAVKYQTQEMQLPLVVAQGKNPVLLGRNWLEKLNLDWSTIFKVSHAPAVENILVKYEALFEKGYGHIKLYKASIQVREGAQPQFLKARPVPYALKEKVEQELQRLEDEGIIYKVSQSDWAAPVVLVPKKDGSLRMCGDYKMTVKQCADVDQYPLPNTETFFATLAGGQVFSKIDLSHAYQQVELDEDSQKYLTINTHKGLYRYKRLPFGVSSAPAIFQRIMDQLLQGVKFTVCHLDEILISGGFPSGTFGNPGRSFRALFSSRASRTLD